MRTCRRWCLRRWVVCLRLGMGMGLGMELGIERVRVRGVRSRRRITRRTRTWVRVRVRLVLSGLHRLGREAQGRTVRSRWPNSTVVLLLPPQPRRRRLFPLSYTEEQLCSTGLLRRVEVAQRGARRGSLCRCTILNLLLLLPPLPPPASPASSPPPPSAHPRETRRTSPTRSRRPVPTRSYTSSHHQARHTRRRRSAQSLSER